jgi:hypothetical protein
LFQAFSVLSPRDLLRENFDLFHSVSSCRC